MSVSRDTFLFSLKAHRAKPTCMKLTKEYVIDDVPDPVKVDMGFDRYQSEVEVIGSKLRYSREFVRRNVLIPPDRTEDLRKLEGIIGADEVAAVVLKRAQ